MINLKVFPAQWVALHQLAETKKPCKNSESRVSIALWGCFLLGITLTSFGHARVRVWHCRPCIQSRYPYAVPYTVHMEEIKVRHGAKARNGPLVLILCVSRVTRRGHSVLAKRPGNSVVPVDDQNLLFQKHLWDSLTACDRRAPWKWRDFRQIACAHIS